MSLRSLALRVGVVAAAEALILETLADGPKRPCHVRAIATERGLSFTNDVWQAARHRLGVQTTHVAGPVWHWQLPADTLEAEIHEWLDSPEGRFAAYLAERDRQRRWPTLDRDTP